MGDKWLYFHEKGGKEELITVHSASLLPYEVKRNDCTKRHSCVLCPGNDEFSGKIGQKQQKTKLKYVKICPNSGQRR